MGITNYVALLNKKQIELYADSYSPDNELFLQEEQKCEVQIRELNDSKNRVKQSIKDLGIKQSPGNGPEFDPFVMPGCKIVAWVWLPCLFLVFVFHCLIWVVKLVFDISWDTWGWTKSCFYFGLLIEAIAFVGGSVIYGIFYWIWHTKEQAYIKWKDDKESLEEELSHIEQDLEKCLRSLSNIDANRKEVLAQAYRVRLGLPIRSLDRLQFKDMRNRFFDLISCKESYSKEIDFEKKYREIRDFYDKKLQLFYRASVPSEAMSDYVLKVFNKSVKGTNNNRNELILNEINDSSVAILEKRNSEYSDSSLDYEIEKFNNILETDTSGFFTKHDSKLLETQVDALEKCYNSVRSFYYDYEQLSNEINNALGLVRLIAYRNIYLGAELLNIIRENAGGGMLTTMSDSIESVTGLAETNLHVEEFSSIESFKEIASAGIDSALKLIDRGMNDKSMVKVAKENPKAAAIAVAGAAAFGIIESGISAWKKRNEKITSLINKEKIIISNMEKIIDTYINNLSSSERAIELIRAIIISNRGFTAIYRPLYKLVFEDNNLSSISMMELQKLVLAMGEYKKISDSNL